MGGLAPAPASKSDAMIPDRLDKVVEAVADLARQGARHPRPQDGSWRRHRPGGAEREQHALRTVCLARHLWRDAEKALPPSRGRRSPRPTASPRSSASSPASLFGEYLEQIIGRHPDEPAGICQARASLASRQPISPPRRAPPPPLIAEGFDQRRAGPSRPADDRNAQHRHLRGLRPRRDPGPDPRRDAPLRRQPGGAPRPCLAPAPMPSVPLALIEELAGLGVFALTLPEEHGGMGLGKEAMCVVRGTVARLDRRRLARDTRCEIASELILAGGTEEQKRRWLPRLAAGEILPTARLHRARHRLRSRQPEDAGGARRRRLSHHRQQDLDHAPGPGRSHDLARPHRSEQTRLSRPVDVPLPRSRAAAMPIRSRPAGMSGGEIEVLGYRGMKEYRDPLRGLRGRGGKACWARREGQGFKQLMADLRGARIQTAARAIGVAQNALDARPRLCPGPRPVRQADHRLPAHRRQARAGWRPRSWSARQLTYLAAREKDAGRRCDLEAGHGQAAGGAHRLERLPTMHCRSMAAMALRWNIRSAACCATPASSTSSRAPPRSRPRSLPPAGCSMIVDRGGELLASFRHQPAGGAPDFGL